MDDGPTTFTFKVFELPPGPRHDGEAEFDFILDSNPPAVADFRYWSEKDGVWMSWAVLETGSGLLESSMEMMISQNGKTAKPWSVFKDTDLKDGRIDVVVPGLKGDDIEVSLRMSDRVGNGYSSDQPFLVSTDLLPLHDISIETIEYGPELVIINQQVDFKAVVNNEGTEDESDVKAVVLRNGDILKYITIPSLPAGSQREVRWSWNAVEGVSDITLKLDPQGSIDDAYPEDNVKTIIITSEYLDVTAKEDHLIISNPEAENMEIVSLHFSIRSIGSVESGPIKVTFQQDGRFMGIFQLESIYKEGSRELVVDWKVDTGAGNLTLLIDPYNEILESVEDNNIIIFRNPFHIEPQGPVDPGIEEPGDDTGAREDQGEIPPNPPKTENEGGTIWKGPETGEEVEEVDNAAPQVPIEIQPTPDDPSLTPPFVMPMAGVLIGTTFLGLAVFGLRSEVFRFKFLGLLIPLYSKLKKTKIEKGIRHEILGYLKAKPGANYSELKRNLDLNDGSLVHHLRILEREEKVYSKKMGKYKLFYVSTYRRQTSIRDYISPFQLRIMEIILQNPGIVPKKLSAILDRSQTDMSYHLTELSRSGLLEKRKKGRNIHYYISDEYTDILV
jgi:DNA-binding transcriptional ArsR family regulator